MSALRSLTEGKQTCRGRAKIDANDPTRAIEVGSPYHLPGSVRAVAMSDGHWQLEGTAAELYQRYLVPAITTKWAEDLLDRARPRAREAVLDVACGTGVVARLAARRVAPAQVTGLDLNPGMLAVARGVPNEGAQISWIEGSALDLPFPPASFDVVLCQLGLQFFPNQRRALGEMRRVLKDIGRAALSVYGPIERTPGAYAFVLALGTSLPYGPNRAASAIGRRADDICSL